MLPRCSSRGQQRSRRRPQMFVMSSWCRGSSFLLRYSPLADRSTPRLGSKYADGPGVARHGSLDESPSRVNLATKLLRSAGSPPPPSKVMEVVSRRSVALKSRSPGLQVATTQRHPSPVAALFAAWYLRLSAKPCGPPTPLLLPAGAGMYDGSATHKVGGCHADLLGVRRLRASTADDFMPWWLHAHEPRY